MALVVALKRPSAPEAPCEQPLKRLRRCRGHYDVLGVSRDSSSETIRKSFLRLALISHPDRGGDDARFRTVMQAYKILHNDESRKSYDQTLSVKESSDGMSTNTERTASDAAEGAVNVWCNYLPAASILLTSFLDAQGSSMEPALAREDSQVLETLQHVLINGFPPSAPSKAPEGRTKHIKVSQKGEAFEVTLYFCGFIISSGTTRSFDEALRWHIAIHHIVMLAKARLGLGLGKSADDKIVADPSVVPIALSELNSGLRLDPSLEMKFSQRTTRTTDSKQQVFGTTPSLPLATALRKILLSTTSKVDLMMREDLQVRDVLREIVQDKQARSVRKQQILVAVSRTLWLREVKNPNVANTLAYQSKALALMDIAHSLPMERIPRRPPPAYITSPPLVPRLGAPARLPLLLEDVLGVTISSVALIDVFRLRSSSRSFSSTCQKEIEKRCRTFTYSSEDFCCTSRQTRHTPAIVAERLRMFLNLETFSPFFVEVDVVKSPKAFFNFDAFQSTISKMCHLTRIVLPVRHISSARRRVERIRDVNKFVERVLPCGVDYECVNNGDRLVVGKVQKK